VQGLALFPLRITLPAHRRSNVDDRHVETIDILPTLLDLTGVEAQTELDGRSLLRPLASQARRMTIFHRIGTELNTVGGEYTFQVEDLERRWARAIRRKLALFGSGGGRNAEALYRIGPQADLIGRRAAALALTPVAATIDQAEDLGHVEPHSEFVPGEITGAIPAGRPGGGRPIAVAVNGTVAATGFTFSLEGSAAESLAVIVPESAFRRGANEVRVFELAPD
jgi:hypothetical protein